jgi:alpha-N-acetylglucosaminidase
VLANYATPLQKKWVNAFKEKDSTAFKKYSKQFLQLIADVDELLATRKDFLLGRWLAAAKNQGATEEEKIIYERNARDIITLWGDANSPLHEYANRQWSGLLNDFYKKRWEMFFVMLNQSLEDGREPNLKTFEKSSSNWEWDWVNKHNIFPVNERGNSVDEAKKMYNKYLKQIEEAY